MPCPICLDMSNRSDYKACHCSNYTLLLTHFASVPPSNCCELMPNLDLVFKQDSPHHHISTSTMRSTTIISIALINIFTATIEGSIVVRGNDCEFIQLESITSNTGCSSGTKFVLKVKTIVISRINLATFCF